MSIIQHEFDGPAANPKVIRQPLEELTFEQYLELAGRGEVRQVYEPIFVRTEYGPNVLVETINRLAQDYRDANAYMAGRSALVNQIITPVVFYHVDRK